MRAATVALGCVLALQLTPAALQPPAGTAPIDDARDMSFEGSWSATGRRQTLPTESGRVSAITSLSGSVALTSVSALGSGFQAEAIGFDDGVRTVAGRAVWTDARGDRVFSTLTGETLQQGRRVVGTITGGTGRYAGVTGEYELTWQYVVSDEGDVVYGRSHDLRGRVQRRAGAR